MKLIVVFKSAFMINPEILANIQQALGAIEQKEGVRVLVAFCEMSRERLHWLGWPTIKGAPYDMVLLPMANATANFPR